MAFTGLFKVLNEDDACLYGQGTWDLPKGKKPGKWRRVTGDLVLCENAIHATTDPLRWRGQRLYAFEAQGNPLGDGSDKGGFRAGRLLFEITKAWPWLTMYPRVRAFLVVATRARDKDADIRWANLSGADLSGAYLNGAYLSRANLSGADLNGADLSRAYLSRAYRLTNPPAGWAPDANGYLVKTDAKA